MAILFSIIVILYVICIAMAIYGWQKKEHMLTVSNNDIPCSIVIAARNEEVHIKQLINDLTQQTYPLEQMQIIIANDHSTDNTATIAREHAQGFPSIQIIDMPPHIQGKKQSIAYILSLTFGRYILFTDADCRIPKTWVETYIKHIEKHEGHFYFGNVSHHRENSVIEKCFTLDFLAMIGVQGGMAKLGKAFSCNAANMCISREFYRTAYDTRATYDSGDDVFLLHKAKEQNMNGVHYIQDNAATVITSPPRSISSFIQQRIRWSSKASGYTDTHAILVTAIVYAMNFTICCTAIFSILWPQYTIVMGLLFAAKTSIDIVLFSKILPYFNKKHILWLVPLFQCVYVFYITFIPIFASIIPKQWKQRKIR